MNEKHADFYMRCAHLEKCTVKCTTVFQIIFSLSMITTSFTIAEKKYCDIKLQDSILNLKNLSTKVTCTKKKYSIEFLLWYLQILYIKRVVRQLFYFRTWMFVYTWQERKGLMNVFRHAVDVGLKGFGQCVDDVPWKNIMSMMTTECTYTHLVLLLYYSMFNSPLNWVKTWQFNAVQQWILSQLFLPTSVGIIKLGVYGQRNSTIKSPPAQVMSM